MPLTLKLVDEKLLTLNEAIALLTHKPAEIIGVDTGHLGVGATDRESDADDAAIVVAVYLGTDHITIAVPGTTAAKASDCKSGGGAVDTGPEAVKGAGVDLGVVLVVDRGARCGSGR